jgi:hypothetical protein
MKLSKNKAGNSSTQKIPDLKLTKIARSSTIVESLAFYF